MTSYKKLYENQLKQIKNLKTNLAKVEHGNSNKIQAEQLELKRLNLLIKKNNLEFQEGDFIYLNYIRKNENKSTLCFIKKETINHIIMLCYDFKRKTALKYLIHKEHIKNVKAYDGEDKSIITYKELLSLYENKKQNDKY